MSPRLEAMAAALVVIGLTTGPASTAPFDQIVIFGDSLSDNGNAGRYSNGPVWVEQLGAALGLTVQPSEVGGSNFAVGGARLDPNSGPTSLRSQTDLYLRRPRRAGRILYIVFGGGNDVLAAVEAPEAEMMIDAAAASLKSIVTDLAAYGATDILVPNLPDVGMTPAMQRRGERALAQARSLSARFNDKSDEALTEVTSRHDVHIYRVDVHTLAERVREDPGSLGFVDVTTPCIDRASCEGFLFWDEVHPTTRAHARLADAALGVFQER
jgi:phospholipase/lecithinase/hemolysin